MSALLVIERVMARREAAVAVVDGKAFWVVVVPIYAPQPVGLVAASIPLIAVAAIAALLVVARFPRGQFIVVAH